MELMRCLTEVRAVEEFAKNAEEALNLYLEVPERSILSFPLPLRKSTHQ